MRLSGNDRVHGGLNGGYFPLPTCQTFVSRVLAVGMDDRNIDTRVHTKTDTLMIIIIEKKTLKIPVSKSNGAQRRQRIK